MQSRLEILQGLVNYEQMRLNAVERATRLREESTDISNGLDLVKWKLQRASINWQIAQRLDNRIKTLIEQL